ncbi:hypothetical protein [Anaeromicropila herbilytica]|uniref:Uncharacterized protein n=1 Tax=Anaeromicropila herbilytica TaxID=2785025 RepID=A0A7R7IEY6_9FIRM|nr:hypothetical protein [Anaeromicropila herbilytica]BCN32614.1 hypothetical protein bsdtb5_39090 [Anaeromicropila herbilytica]
MILNEVSLTYEPFCKTIQDAHNIMQIFINTYIEYEKINGAEEFFYTYEFHNIIFTDSYTIHNWLQDKSVEKRYKDKFRSIINRGHFVNAQDYVDSEVYINSNDLKIKSVGCLIAHENNSFVVSFCFNPLWNHASLPAEYIYIIDDDFKNENISIPNISEFSHINLLPEKLLLPQNIVISSPHDLWINRYLLFPNLILCDCVEKQLDCFNDSLRLSQVIKRLSILDNYFKKYDGTFDREALGHNARDESESVKTSAHLSSYRYFKAPDGDYTYFYWHISFGGQFPGRIHFLPSPSYKKGIIGYIGKHLPTSKFSTI